MTVPERLSDETRERLRVLTERHTVGITAGGAFCGSGFVVTPDTVITCAHVVAGRDPAGLVALVEGRSVAVDVVRMVPESRGEGSIYGFPDLAELRLAESAHDLGGVWLDDSEPLQSASVSVHGFSGHTLEQGVQPDTLRLQVAGRSGQYVRLQWDQVVQGFSGGPVLDTGTGRVCGVLKASRHEKGMSGGWLIPIDALEQCSPGLLERNRLSHRPGTPWFDTVGERLRRQRELFGPDPGSEGGGTTPAQMLSRGAMPFVERPELGELVSWCHESPDHLLRVLYAPGGSGKTRLSAQLCGLLREEGWVAGFAEVFTNPLAQERWLENMTSALAAGFPALVVFDYAQARVSDVCELLAHIHRHRPQDATLRVLLLARSETPLRQLLQEELAARHIEEWALREASAHRLPNSIEGREPESLAVEAFGEFARQLDCAWVAAPDGLGRTAGRQDSLLGVLATALDAVLTLRQGEAWAENEDPLARICWHEIKGWHALLEDRLGTDGPLAGRTGRLMAEGLLLVPTLARRRERRELTALLRRVHEAAFPDADRRPSMAAVHGCLRALYPAQGSQVAVLEPDRVGEILARRVLLEPESCGEATDYLAAVLGADVPGVDDARAETVLETLDVLARARGCTAVGRVMDHPAHAILDEALSEAVGNNPRLLVPALTVTGARVPHAEPLAELIRPALEQCDTALLLQVETRLPGYAGGLSGVSALVLERLLAVPDRTTPDGTTTDEDRLVRLRRLMSRSLRLQETARGSEALRVADEAVVLARDLVRRSGRHQRPHAAALHNLSLLRHRAGDTASALELNVEAVSIYRNLADEEAPQRPHLLLDTAWALSTLALLRLADGQVNGAAEDAAEGVLRCESAADGARRQDVLLQCLETLAECRMKTGLTDEALVTAAEAVALLRELARRRPAQYVARLPHTLQLHGLWLIRAGRFHEAHDVLQEAVRRRAVLPLQASPHLRKQQRTALSVLVQLTAELDEFADERTSWREMEAVLDGLTD
ncbi:trypsin-like peptidase domain-containing protein [Streptomyces sp. NPDC006475]|uniref:trypsin-like peptidase domain-containing protein n=1 Tax=Streptomyces sp. NPDC006475 TaxID=3155719 RepID=UPI0033B49FB7